MDGFRIDFKNLDRETCVDFHRIFFKVYLKFGDSDPWGIKNKLIFFLENSILIPFFIENHWDQKNTICDNNYFFLNVPINEEITNMIQMKNNEFYFVIVYLE